MENQPDNQVSQPNHPPRRQLESTSPSLWKADHLSNEHGRPKFDRRTPHYGNGPIEPFIPNQCQIIPSSQNPHQLTTTSHPSRSSLGTPFEYILLSRSHGDGGHGSLNYIDTAATPSGYGTTSRDPFTTAWTNKPHPEPTHTRIFNRSGIRAKTNLETPQPKDAETCPILVHTQITTSSISTDLSAPLDRSGVIFIDPLNLPSAGLLNAKIRNLISSGRFALNQRLMGWLGMGFGMRCDMFVAVRWNIDLRAEATVPDAPLRRDGEVRDALALVVQRGGRDHVVVRCVVKENGGEGSDEDPDETKIDMGMGGGDRMERGERMWRNDENGMEGDEDSDFLWMKQSMETTHWPRRRSHGEAAQLKTPQKRAGESKIPRWSGSPRVDIEDLGGTMKATDNHPAIPSPLKLSHGADLIEIDEGARNGVEMHQPQRWPFGIKGRVVSIDDGDENERSRGHGATSPLRNMDMESLRSSVLTDIDPNIGPTKRGYPRPRSWRPPGARSIIMY